MVVGDDEGNVLRLYHERVSGLPVKTFDFTSKLPFGATEMDIESSARAGNTLYSGNGRGGRVGERDDHGVGWSIGPRKRPERHRVDRHEQGRAADDHAYRR